MKINKSYKLLAGIIFLLLITAFSFGENNMNNYLNLYYFNDANKKTEFEWTDFTDQVMGGKSEGSSSIMQEDEELFLRLNGNVSLKNNGGFIQSRLKLAKGLSNYDASEYDGIRLLVRGEGSGYYLFFRTSKTFFPWLYYSAPIKLTSEWQIIDIPWTVVSKGDFGNPGSFNQSKLKSIALVAYGKEFVAKVDLKQIGLYKEN